MTSDYLVAVGAEYRKETQRIEPKLLFFGLALLISHVLEIKPSDFDVGGIKVAIKDVSVIHGGIALIYLYYFWSYVASAFQGSALMPIEFNRRVSRHLLKSAKKPYKNEKSKRMTFRTPKQVKRHAWWAMFWFQLFLMPFVLLMIALMFLAWIVGLYDAWTFSEYIYERLLIIWA
ncbi:hypothetical protein [Hephaestia mangrovi]|uniref:hypothetical protein n=1 Tax=Hephaestia mangrovi TaxID=2873268 RepID=UPI001CA72FAD|nr:hypothetical protein [Hephaestia mangrovi]MBY8827774.1 hypothetical protein [Hephaestia mangrovi]